MDEPELPMWVHCGEVASCADIARRSRLPFSAAGVRAARLMFSQQRLFSGVMRAVHRAESAGELR